MRTVTFSDPEVAEAVNGSFVAAWHNRGPGFSNDDYRTETSIFSTSMEAYTTKNICTFFLAPDGEAFFYLAGYYSPDFFLRVLRTVMTVRSALFDEAMRLRPDGMREARRAHAALARQTEERLKEVRARMWMEFGSFASWRTEEWQKIVAPYRSFTYRGATHEHRAECVPGLVDGFSYLGELHRRWSRTEELPDLEAVRYAYLYGNPFTEEADGARTIEPAPARATVAAPRPAQPPAPKRAEPGAKPRTEALKYPAGRSYAGVMLRRSP